MGCMMPTALIELNRVYLDSVLLAVLEY